MYINANQILTELNDNKPFKNPLVLKHELIEAELIKKEDFLQKHVNAIFEDKEYYSSFQDAALPEDVKALDLIQEAPEVPQTVQVDPNEAKAKSLQAQMDSIERQQKTNNTMNPRQKLALEEKKMQIRAVIEKLRIDSDERVANKRIASGDKNVLKRTVAGGLSSGVGMALPGAAIAGIGAGLSKVPWGRLGSGLATASRSVAGMFT
jgi:hypothetical protein